MAYKKLIKVSNVCQLLDKSKYPATTTKEGITWTNNGDGTFTVNGTAESGSGLRLDTFYIEGNRTYLMAGCPEGGGAGKYFMFDGYSKLSSDVGSGTIKTVSGSDRTLCSPILYVVAGQTVSNLVFKPQLFDLTEIYRAGNEPTTVEEFRQDFPEEMYDYSPHCWLTSYKRVFVTGGGKYLTSYQRNLTCKTKNLFDISKVLSSDIANGSILERGSNYFIVQGDISDSPGTSAYSNGWFRPLHNHNSPNSMYLKAGVVTVSAYFTVLKDNSVSGSVANIYLYGAAAFTPLYSSLPPVGVKTLRSKTFTIPEGKEGFYLPVFTLNSSKIRIENIQVEYGDTATDYVPYGHL